MMFDNLVLNAQNVLFAGVTGSLIEVVDNPLMINVPDYMQVGYFEFDNSSTTRFSFNSSIYDFYLAYISGRIYSLASANSIGLEPADFVYDQTSGKYRVYMVTLGSVPVTQSDFPFTIVQEAISNVIE